MKSFRRGREALAAVLLASLTTAGAAAAAADIGAARKAELLYLLAHDCGSCHGMKRLGGLGPPLTAEALAGRSAEDLAQTILGGVPGTPMPPWRPFLSPGEARWLAGVLINGDGYGKPEQ